MEHSGEYFANSPWGSLSLDRKFLSYNTLPLVFSLLDTAGNHYVSICVSWHPDYEWLVVDATASELISLISDSITVSNLLTAKGKKKIYGKWPEHADSIEYYEYEQFPVDILPQENAYLELNQEEYSDYVAQLLNEQKRAGRAYSIINIPKVMVYVYRIQYGPISCSPAASQNHVPFGKKTYSPPKKGYWFSVEQKYTRKISRLPC